MTTHMDERVYLKKATGEAFHEITRQVSSLGYSLHGAEKLPWNPISPHDDDTFGELIFDTSQSACTHQLAGLTGRTLRKKLRHFQRYSPLISYLKLSDTNLEPLHKMLEEHFGHDPDAVSAYRNMLDILKNSEELWADHAVLTYNGDPVGFFAYELLNASTAGIYATVASRKLTGLSEAMYLKIFGDLAAKNIRYATLGGSETVSLYDYKRKFCPVREINLSISVLDLS